MEVEQPAEVLEMRAALVPHFEYFHGMLQEETGGAQQDPRKVYTLHLSPFARLRPDEWFWVKLCYEVHIERVTRKGHGDATEDPLTLSIKTTAGLKTFSVARQLALIHAMDFYGGKSLLRALLRATVKRMLKLPIEQLALELPQGAGEFVPRSYKERVAVQYARRRWCAEQLAQHWLGGNQALLQALMARVPPIGALVALGDAYDLVVTRGGLMARGANVKGVLGLGDREYRHEYVRVPRVKGDLIAVATAVSYNADNGDYANRDHAFVLTTRGLYFAGRTEHGPSFTNSTQTRLKRLRVVDGRALPPIVAVACSGRELLLATDSGKVWWRDLTDLDPGPLLQRWRMTSPVRSMQCVAGTGLICCDDGLYAYTTTQSNSAALGLPASTDAFTTPLLVPLTYPPVAYTLLTDADDDDDRPATPVASVLYGIGALSSVGADFRYVVDEQWDRTNTVAGIRAVATWANFIVFLQDRKIAMYDMREPEWDRGGRIHYFDGEGLDLYASPDRLVVVSSTGLFDYKNIHQGPARVPLLMGHEDVREVQHPENERPEKKARTTSQCLRCAEQSVASALDRYRFCSARCSDAFFAFQRQNV